MARVPDIDLKAIYDSLEQFRGLLHESEPDFSLIAAMLSALHEDALPHSERYVVDVMTHRGMLKQFCEAYGRQIDREIGAPAEGWFFDLQGAGQRSLVCYDGRQVSGVYRVELAAQAGEMTTAKVFVHIDRANVRVNGDQVEFIGGEDE